jgi:putative addiction module component (TIGR02574 family)
MSQSNLNYKELPVSERIELVEDIWDSIAEETPALALSADEVAELQRRLAAHRADPSSGIPWEQVREELFQSRR